MGVAAGLLSGDPPRGAGPRGDASVEALRKLEDDPRLSGPAVGEESGIVPFGIGGEESHLDVDARIAEAGEPASPHPFVGIFQGADDAADSRGNHGLGARGSGSVMGAGLQGYVEGGVPAAFSCGGEGLGLGVGSAPAAVRPFPDHFAVAHDHRSDQGSRTDPPPPSPRQGKGAAHVEPVPFHSTFTITCRDPMLSSRSQACTAITCSPGVRFSRVKRALSRGESNMPSAGSIWYTVSP